MVQTKKPDWSKRIERAMDLAGQRSTAEVLAFYGRILEFQRGLYDGFVSRPAPALNGSSAFREQLDVDAALQGLPALLSLARKIGPSRLALQAAELGSISLEQQRQMLLNFLDSAEASQNESNSFFARVLFQPMAEYYAAAQSPQPAASSSSVCPVCGAKPQVAVLRPEGNGGKRSLICSFCMTEWEFRRILCPVCGEEDHARLPRYSAEGVSAVRVEACDGCRHYLKSVDMTVDGLAVPLVDEVATVPLDLWAAEHGYTKITLNLMGF